MRTRLPPRSVPDVTVRTPTAAGPSSRPLPASGRALRPVLREVSPVPVDWLLLALAWALLVGGVGVLASLRRRRLLVPAWSIGGLFIGGGAYGMVEGFVRHTVLRTSSASSYWWCEALAAAVVVLGAWALRHPRAHSR